MNIISQLIEIILLKRQPQDIDYDVNYAVMFLVAAIGLTYIGNSLSGVYSKPLAYSLVQNFSQAVFLYFALSLAKKQNRFVQTCTAFFGTGTILLVLMLVAFLVPALSIFGVLLHVWMIYLSIKIIRAAFGFNLISAIFLMISIAIFSFVTVTTVYPDFLKETQSIITQQAASTE